MQQCILPGITKTVADLKVRELSPFLATKQMQVPLSASVTSSSDRILTQASLLTLISLAVGRIWQRLSLTFKILASEVNVASWLTCFNHLMCGVSCDLKKYDSFYQLCCISELLANDVFLVSIKFIYSEKATEYMNFNTFRL